MSLVEKCKGSMAIKTGELAKLSMDTVVNRTIAGVVCTINSDSSDPHRDLKITAITDALTKINAKGYTLPAAITFYLADGETVVPGFEAFARNKAPTKAYARDGNAADAAVVFLGRNSVASDCDLNGIANKLHTFVTAGFTAMVAAHEIGHLLHEYHAPGVSYGDLNLKGGDIAVARQHISEYASANKLEVVAEVFCAHIYDWKLSSQANKLYEACNGPPLL
jgi:hypothetical protein